MFPDSSWESIGAAGAGHPGPQGSPSPREEVVGIAGLATHTPGLQGASRLKLGGPGQAGTAGHPHLQHGREISGVERRRAQGEKLIPVCPGLPLF